MSAISQVLYDIIHARFGKDVRQAIHDGIELGYDIASDAQATAETAQDSASASATAAANSASAAQTAANNASISAGLAEQYKDEAFHTTPAGYEDFVSETNAALTKRAVLSHNVPRLVPKDITSYVTDGTLWQRLNGTNGFDLFEDIYCGDYIHMSRAISAYEQTQTYQATGSDYVTIAEIDGKMGDGDSSQVTYHHLVMVAGKGFGGTQHFGRSRMNPTNTTVGGYVGSEMFTTTIGAVVSSGSTASQATINQQLYAEFGSHLKTIRQLLSNSINATGYNRLGTNSGCSNNWAWTSVQAFLMDEIEVYGSVVWGSSGYDVGNGNHQFALFRHSKEAMNNRTSYYWLKDVVAAAYFAHVDRSGNATYYVASNATDYVRPCFVIA